MTLPGGETLTYDYHKTTGNLTSLTAADGGKLSFAYDGSLPTKTTWTGTVAGSVGYTYNNDFLVTAQTVNGANSVSYTYDNDGLLTGAGSLSIARNADNGLLTGTILGSVTDSVTYNAFGEATKYQAQAGGSTVFDCQFTYDSLGRIASKTEVVGSESHTYRYSYDTIGQLTDVYKDGGLASHYEYDANGNRTAYTGAKDSVAVTSYDAQDRLTKYGGNIYQYTANGELQSKTDSNGKTIYEYDVLGNLDAVTLTDGTKIAYLVDGANRRIGRKVNGVLKQGFLYQDGLNPVAELDNSNNVVSRFVYGTRGNVPDYMVKDGVTYRIISDHLGSVRLVVNAETGDIAQKMEYDEFGRVLKDTNPGFQPFGYAGGIYDKDTGLVRFGARDYDSETGRWTCKDPVGFGGGNSNLYGYCVNDPINWYDPSGLTKNDPWYGHNEKDFQNWYHRRYKPKYGPRVRSKEEIDDAYEEWKDEGKPGPDSKGKNKGKNKNQCETTEPNSYAPFVMTRQQQQQVGAITLVTAAGVVLTYIAEYGWVVLAL